MLAFLRRRAWFNGTLGAAVACLLAVQMLVAGVVAAQSAAEAGNDLFVICYGDSTQNHAGDKSDTHAGHASCAVCALVSASPPRADAVTLPSRRVASVATRWPLPALPIVPLVAGNPRTSQGPPPAA